MFEVPVTGSTRLRAMIGPHPSCLRVLMKHGWAGCGGAAGPDETYRCRSCSVSSSRRSSLRDRSRRTRRGRFR